MPKSPPLLQFDGSKPKSLAVRKERRINGHFAGELVAQGKVIVGPEGFVKAHISLDELEVFGRVRGNIAVNRIVLHPSAYIDGNITAKSIHVEEGAKVVGTITLATEGALALTSSAS